MDDNQSLPVNLAGPSRPQPFPGTSQSDPQGIESSPVAPVQGDQAPSQPVSAPQAAQSVDPELVSSVPEQPVEPISQPAGVQNQMPAGQGLPSQPEMNPQQQGSGVQAPQPFENAPEGFRQPPTSVFSEQPNTEKPKKRKFNIFSCFCVLFLFLFLSVSGVSAYAYFTDTYIPVISDIINRFKGDGRNPNEEAKVIQQQLANALIGTLLPMFTDDGSLLTTFSENSLSDEYVDQLLQNYESLQSYRFDADINISSDSDQFSINLTGAIDNSDGENPMFQTSFYTTIPVDDDDEEIAGEMRAIGQDTYLKLDSYPDMSAFLGEDLNVEGQWIDASADDAQNVSDIYIEEGERGEVTDEDIDKLVQFLTDESVIKNTELMDDEEIHQNSCSCVRLSWNQLELTDVIRRYNEIFEETMTEEEINEAVEDIESLQIESCVGKETQMIHRIKVIVTGTAETDGSWDINLKLWDYNQDIEVTAPEDAITFEEVLEDLDFYKEFQEQMQNAEDVLIQANISAIQMELQLYYIDNQEYPDSLNDIEDLDLSEYDLEDLEYNKTDDGYSLAITLPSGTPYEVTGENLSD